MKRARPGAIAIPNGLLHPESAEVARIWITNNAGSTVLIDAEILADPMMFGYLIADTVRHAAKAYAGTSQFDENQALQAIVNGLGEELREQFNAVTPLEGKN